MKGGEELDDLDRYRIEFYLLDAPFAVVHKYALDDNEGFKYLDLATGEAAVEPPVLVPLAELPPAHLCGEPELSDPQREYLRHSERQESD